MFHNYETEKITRKASDAAAYIEMFGSFTEPFNCVTQQQLLLEYENHEEACKQTIHTQYIQS